MENIVSIESPYPHVALIRMCDKANKNTFTGDFVQGLTEAFNSIQKDESFKVIVVTGYDSYFAAGGSKAVLQALNNRQGKFTDSSLHDLPLRCEIPVISAIQGHAIGGGLVFGLLADIAVLSSESIYTANFMEYGFTPGLGATLILKEKLGLSLAQEMFYSAARYRGIDLEKRGVQFQVLPRQQVLKKALAIANDIAKKPRLSLVTLKSHMTQAMRQVLPIVVRNELDMHDKTMHQPEVKERINEFF